MTVMFFGYVVFLGKMDVVLYFECSAVPCCTESGSIAAISEA